MFVLTIKTNKQLRHIIDGHHRSVVELRLCRLDRLTGRRLVAVLRRVGTHKCADRRSPVDTSIAPREMVGETHAQTRTYEKVQN